MSEPKREIVGLMREKGLSLAKAAEIVGASVWQAYRWRATDHEYGQAVDAARLARQIQFILEADDLSRKGRKLSEAEKLKVDTGRKMLALLPKMFPRFRTY
jgi:transposase-like protein